MANAKQQQLLDRIASLEATVDRLNNENIKLEILIKTQNLQITQKDQVIDDNQLKISEFQEVLHSETTKKKEYELLSKKKDEKIDELVKIQEFHQKLNNDLAAERDSYVKHIKALESDMNLSLEKTRAHESNLAQLNKEIAEKESLKQQIEQMKAENQDQIQSLIEVNNSLSGRNDDLQSALTNHLSQLESTHNEKKNLETNLESVKQELTITNDKMKASMILPTFSDYDIVADVDSLLSLKTKGWEVKINPSVELEKKLQQQTILVGITGLANRGKTFLTNILCNDKLPYGFHVKTKGLSLKYSKQGDSLASFLDSAGFETPVAFNKEEYKTNDSNIDQLARKKEILNDRNITEDFIQSYILETSNVILIVVGQLSFSDQKLIAKITQRYKKKNIFICHNFFSIHKLSDVKPLIQSSILDAFSVEPKIMDKQIHKDQANKNSTVYIDYRTGVNALETEPIIHLVFAKDETEAGEYFNETSTQYLINHIIAQKIYKSYNLVESLLQYTQNNLKTYVDFQSAPTSSNLLAHDKNNNTLAFKENVEFKLKPVEYDVLGERKMIIENYSNVYEPDYSIIYSQEGVNLLYDVPNLSEQSPEFQLEVTSDGYFLTLTAKKLLENEVTSSATYVNNRKFGSINQRIRVGDVEKEMEFGIDAQNPEKVPYKYANGVLMVEVKYKKKVTRNVIKFGKK